MSSSVAGSAPSFTEEEAVRQVYQRFETAFRQGDIEGMAAVVAEDAVFAWDQLEVLGRPALTAQFAANLAGAWKGANATHTIRGVQVLSPDVAMAWGSYAVVLHDGATMHGHIMNTFIKRNGQWLIVAEQTASAPSGD